MKKLVTSFLPRLALIIFAVLLLNSCRNYIPQTGSQSSPPRVTDSPSSSISTPISIMGTTVCLPHRNQAAGQTLECTIGIKTSDDRYYGLSFDPQLINIEIDQQLQIEGRVHSSETQTYLNDQTIDVESYKKL